jgi:hypothetical protein
MAMKHAPCRSGRAHGHHGATGFTCAPASETFKLPGRRMLEPISLRFEASREKEAALSALVRAAGSKSLSPPRQFEQSWRPRTPKLKQLPLFFYRLLSRSGCAGHVRRSRINILNPPRRTNSSRIVYARRCVAVRYYASTQALAATKIAANHCSTSTMPASPTSCPSLADERFAY